MKFVKSTHLTSAVASIASFILPKDLNIGETSKIPHRKLPFEECGC